MALTDASAAAALVSLFGELDCTRSLTGIIRLASLAWLVEKGLRRAEAGHFVHVLHALSDEFPRVALGRPVPPNADRPCFRARAPNGPRLLRGPTGSARAHACRTSASTITRTIMTTATRNSGRVPSIMG